MYWSNFKNYTIGKGDRENHTMIYEEHHTMIYEVCLQKTDFPYVH